MIQEQNPNDRNIEGDIIKKIAPLYSTFRARTQTAQHLAYIERKEERLKNLSK